MSIRGCEMRMTVIPFLNAMARGSGVSSPAPAAIRVPGAEGRGDSRARGPDEAGDDRHRALVEDRKQPLADPHARLFHEGLSAAEALVGDDHAARVHGRRRSAACFEGGGEDLARRALADPGDGIDRAQSQLLQVVHPRIERAQLGDEAVEVGEQRILAPVFDEGGDRGVVARAERIGHALPSRVAREGEPGTADEQVGDAAEGGDDDDDLAGPAGAHEVGHGPDTVGGAHRGPAELHHDHGSRSRAFSISALRMAAPAAPRMVLWTSASSFRSKVRSSRTRPTETAMPPSRSRSSRGWGRSGASRTWMGWRGAVGRCRSCGSPRNSARARAASAALAFRSRRAKTAIVWPSLTATRCTEAEIAKGAGTNVLPSNRPRMRSGSASIFSSSPPPM